MIGMVVMYLSIISVVYVPGGCVGNKEIALCVCVCGRGDECRGVTEIIDGGLPK